MHYAVQQYRREARDNLDSSLGRAERQCRMTLTMHWLRRRLIINALYRPTTSPLPRRRTDNCVTMAEDVSDFTNKFLPRHCRPAVAADRCLHSSLG